jgi:hypothetical protein
MCCLHFEAIKTAVAISEKEIVRAFLLSRDMTSNVYNQELGRSDFGFMHKQTKRTTQLAVEYAVFLFFCARGFILNHLHIHSSFIYLYRD